MSLSDPKIGSAEWNNQMYAIHPTPYTGLPAIIEHFRIRAIVDEIRAKMRNDHFSLVEIGCEAGGLLQHIQRAFPQANLYGTDISADALHDASKKLGPSVVLIESDLTNVQSVPVEINCKLDFVLCSETLEHIPDTTKALEGLSKFVGEDSTVIITVPNERLKKGIKYLLTRTGLFKLLLPGIEKDFSEWHVQDFSREDLMKKLSSFMTLLRYRNIIWFHHLVVAERKR